MHIHGGIKVFQNTTSVKDIIEVGWEVDKDVISEKEKVMNMEGVKSDEVEDMDLVKEGIIESDEVIDTDMDRNLVGDKKRVMDVGKERDMIRDKERDMIRDQERDMIRDKERDLVRDKERDLARDKERDFAKDKERDDLNSLRDGRDKVTDMDTAQTKVLEGDISGAGAAFTTPPPVLTVEKVMEVFKRLKNVNTPDINTKLAIPYKKPPVVDSSLFKHEYSELKESLGRISGKGGKAAYQAEKKRQTSASFSWPDTSSPARVVAGSGGGDCASELAIPAPAAPCSAASYEAEIDKLTVSIKALSNEVVKRDEKIDTLEQKLEEKENAIKSYAKVNIDLKRQLQEVRGGGDDESDEEIERRVAQQGARQKRFSDLGNHQKRVVSQGVMDALKDVSDSRQIDPKQMAGYILKR